jgi:hypothetical protein
MSIHQTNFEYYTLGNLINKSGVTMFEATPEAFFASPQSLAESTRFSFDDTAQEEHIFKSFDFNSINQRLFSPF